MRPLTRGEDLERIRVQHTGGSQFGQMLIGDLLQEQQIRLGRDEIFCQQSNFEFDIQDVGRHQPYSGGTSGTTAAFPVGQLPEPDDIRHGQ